MVHVDERRRAPRVEKKQANTAAYIRIMQRYDTICRWYMYIMIHMILAKIIVTHLVCRSCDAPENTRPRCCHLGARAGKQQGLWLSVSMFTRGALPRVQSVTGADCCCCCCSQTYQLVWYYYYCCCVPTRCPEPAVKYLLLYCGR